MNRAPPCGRVQRGQILGPLGIYVGARLEELPRAGAKPPLAKLLANYLRHVLGDKLQKAQRRT